ncbi:MAG: alpha/beta hydrolase [Polyangiales bacterium]
MRTSILLAMWALVACGDDSAAASEDAGRADSGALDAALDGSQDAAVTRDAGVDAAADATVADVPPPPRMPIDVALDRLGDEASAAAVDAEVEAGGGWPLVEGTRALFVTRWEGPPSAVSWVGTSNEFTPGVDVAASLGAFHFVVVEGAEGKYKWHAGEEFRAPAEARRYGYDEFGEHGWVGAPEEEHYERYRFAEHVVRARVAGATMTRVLVLHDGQNVFSPEAPFGGWDVSGALRAMEVDDVLAISIDNTLERMQEYTHVGDDPFGDGTLIGGDADAYLRLVFEVYVPRVAGAHDLDAAPLAMAGSSLGGLVSLYAALRYEPVAVAALSPTLGWGAYVADGTECIQALHDTRREVAIYLDSGGGGSCADFDGDGIQEDADDSDNYCVTTAYRDHLASLGYEFGADLVHWHEPGAPHNEGAWRARVPRMLESLDAMGW